MGAEGFMSHLFASTCKFIMMASEPDDPPQDDDAAVGTDRQGTLNSLGLLPAAASQSEQEGGNDEEEDEEDEEEEEPQLKYARITGSLGGLYRNGDATSVFLVAGDKMIVGTHNGNIHVLSIPSFQTLRVYHAHSASVTAISISPFPPPISHERSGPINRVVQDSRGSWEKPSSSAASASSPNRPGTQPPVPPLPSNTIHIATSSIDGNVCVTSLVDAKDVVLRNFSRPVQTVALSPDFKSDRSYLSGGLAGRLILTVGGRQGASAKALIGGAAASASGWLETIGLGANTGKDTVLHSGEGAISTIKWSRTGKYVVWVNEQGIKIMRSHLRLDSADADFVWKRISHIDRPDKPDWDEMSSVWKARAEWIDELDLESDVTPTATVRNAADVAHVGVNGTASRPASGNLGKVKKMEKLIVGWGGTVWIIHVHHGGPGVGKEVGERNPGRVEIVSILLTDCIVAGLSLYTPTLLVVLAYTVPDEDEGGGAGHVTAADTPKRGIQHRQNASSPELRLIDLGTSEEVSADALSVSRFESLSAADYHLGIVGDSTTNAKTTTRGALEGIGDGLWTAGLTATKLFTSAASTHGSDAKSDSGVTRTSGKASSADASKGASINGRAKDAHSAAAGAGMKIYIHSPYDCVLATKRDLSDHLEWLLSKERYEESWNLIDEHPEVVSSHTSTALSGTPPATPTKRRTSSEEFFADDVSSTTASATRLANSAAEKEKRRVGERWIQQLVTSGDWSRAGATCGQVLSTSTRWEHWAWEFVRAKKIDEITPYIPTKELRPPLPSVVYEVLLGSYITRDRPRLKELLDRWPPELYDVNSVATAIQEKLRTEEVREDTEEVGEMGRDWRILLESLAKLLLADGRPRDALRSYLRLQDADTAMTLIRDYHLVDAVADDIPRLILLRVAKDQLETASQLELAEATAEAIGLLVDEAHHGLIRPEAVVRQLQGTKYARFLFFYLRALWSGLGNVHDTPQVERLELEGRLLVEDFGDLAVELFAEYDRPLLMEFLKASESYEFERAYAVCERHTYVPELVYLLSKTGQTRRALFLIIDRLGDVSQAISFAKSQADPDLWNDLLEYSMDKPRFIRGLLEEVGTAIDPITLVRRIPKGLEIEGLRDGLSRMIKEYEIQFSISEGVARVLRGEVASSMATLRTGQKQGIKFDVGGVDDARGQAGTVDGEQRPTGGMGRGPGEMSKGAGSGDCQGCGESFARDGPIDNETLVGFACGHIFHLSCLLRSRPNRTDSVDTLNVASRDDGDSTRRSVGAKVTHARLIRAQIGNGCPVVVHQGEK